jgi:hypothetical protein
MRFRIFLFTLALFGIQTLSFGQSIFTNPITGTNPNTANPYTTGQTVDANITVTGIGRGSGAAGTAANNRYNANSWNTGSIDLSAYFEFTLTPNSPYWINFVSFEYIGQASGTGATQFAFRSSVDGFTTDIGTSNATGTTISLAGAAYQNITTAITFRLYAWGASALGGTFSVDSFTFNGIVNSPQVDYCNLQSPGISDIAVGNNTTVYAQVYKAGVTESIGQGAGITGWIGYSSVNSNPNTVADWTWLPATYNAAAPAGNNDEYMATFGSALPEGIYYYASRFQLNGSGYKYGGFSGGFWDGVTNISGKLTINGPNTLDYVNLQTPGTGSIVNGSAFLVYAQTYEPGLTTTPNDQGLGITCEIGYSSTNSNPNGGGWTWVPANFNILNGDPNNDEYMLDLGAQIATPGTYYYASRFKLNTGGYRYGGILSNGNPGSFWDGTTYISGVLNINTTPSNEINVRGVVGSNPTIGSQDFTPSGTDNTQFAAQNIGNSQAKVFRIENTGTLALSVPSITLTGINPGDFSITASAPYTIAAGTFVDFTIIFAPTAAGLRTAIVSIANNDSTPAENPYLFAIEGTGNGAEIDVHGNGISIPSGIAAAVPTNNTHFGSVNIASGSLTNIFSVSNQGNISLTVSGVTITGPGASDFTINVNPTGMLAGTSSSLLTITFDPTVTGIRNAVVTINNNDSNESTYTFNIQGIGTQALNCALGATEIIAQQDFEVSPATPVLPYTFTQDTGAGVATATNGSARGQSRTIDSPKFIGGRSFQMIGHAANSGTEKATIIDFATVNTSAYKEIGLNFKLGAYAVNSTTNGLDSGDEKVKVLISTDNGVTWSQEMDILGNSNSIWDINTGSGSASFNYDGNNIAPIFQPGSSTVNSGPRDITLTNLPMSAQLKIRIILAVDRLDELWAIDNVVLSGKKPLVSTWNSGWTPTVPTATTQAIINSPYNTATGSVSACSCQVNANVTINSSQYFDIQGIIENNASIAIGNNGILIQHNDYVANTGAGNYSLDRATTPYNLYDYTYWSSPMTSATIGTFTGWRTDYAFQFNTANFSDADSDSFDDDQNDWQRIGTGTTMDPGRGYAVMMPTAGYTGAAITVSFNGNVNNGVVPETLALSGNATANDDFNLIGNPYPSAISADDFIAANPNFAGTLYFWTHRLGISGSNPGPDMNNFITTDYAMYSLIGGVTTATASGTGSATPTGLVASGQGFFVEAITPGDVNFTNSMRRNTGNDNFYRASTIRNEVPEAVQKDRIWLNLQNEAGLFSQQLIGYVTNATLGFDRGYDGIVSKTTNTVSFYSFIGEDEYRIQGRPAFDNNDVVPLGYSSNAAGIFTIGIGNREGQLNNPDTQIYLEDKLLNVTHDLTQGAYVFTTETGTFNNRFVLRYTNTALGTPDFDNIGNNVVAAASNGQIRIKSYLEALKKVTVYDISGRQVFQKDNLEGNEFNITDVVLSHQALVVKIALANGQIVNKKIVF